MLYGWMLTLLLVAGNVDSNSAPGNESWPQWRGPTRDGFVAEDEPWPTVLDGLALSWRIETGPGYSGPIVDEKCVYVTETVAERDEVVRALDRGTGKEIWRQSWPGSIKVPFFAKENGDWIRSTPALDGESLYVGGIRDNLVCLDRATGAIRWNVDFVQEFGSPVPTFGFVSSPMVIGDFVYVQAGGGFCKIDKTTGDIAWRTLDDGGGMMGSAFSSPVFAKLADRQQLLVQTRLDLAGVDPDNGKVLWTQRVPNFRGMNILTPIAFNDGVFTSSYNHRSFFYTVTEANKQWSVEKVWENKVKGYMSTPLLIEGHVYLHLQNQRLACLRLSDGKETWISSRRFGKYWSMVGQGRLILGLDQDGTLYLVEADPQELKILAELRLSDQETWGHLAVVGRDLFVRELHGVSAWHWGRPTASSSVK